MNKTGKEIMAYSPSGILTTINIDGPEEHYVESNQPDKGRHVLHIIVKK